MEASNRQIGEVSKVYGPSVVISLSEEASPDSGRLSVRWADYILIQGERFSLVGQITSLEKRDFTSKESHRLIDAKVLILSSICRLDESVSIGVREFPSIGAKCFTMSDLLVRQTLGSMGVDPKKKNVSLYLGDLIDAGKTSFMISPEAMYGRHCAIVGTSGGGKSWSLARIVEESAKYKCKVIIVDATGEFSGLGWPVIHAHIGSNSSPVQNSLEVSMPYFQLLESDLFAIFQPTGDAQAPRLRAAIKTLKLLELEPNLALNGNFMKANKQKQQYNDAYARHYLEIENTQASFNILRLADQLKLECVNEIRSATETDCWGGYNPHEEACVFPLISRVIDVVSSSNLKAIFQPEGLHSLFDIIEWFIGNDEARVLSLSLEHLSFLHRARQIVANSLGRQLMSHARKGTFRGNPLLLVVDEAHQFFDLRAEEGTQEYPLNSFSIVAKEARKYGLNICLGTQRPRDIPESVMSQMGTMLVHRLTNDADRGIIERSCGQADDRVLELLPSLAPGEAVLLGIDIPIPLKLLVKPPKCPPMSRGPDFQKCWGLSEEDEKRMHIPSDKSKVTSKTI